MKHIDLTNCPRVHFEETSEPFYMLTGVCEAIGYSVPRSSAALVKNRLINRIDKYASLMGVNSRPEIKLHVVDKPKHGYVITTDGTMAMVRVAPYGRVGGYNYVNRAAIREIMLLGDCREQLKYQYWVTHDVLADSEFLNDNEFHSKDFSF